MSNIENNKKRLKGVYISHIQCCVDPDPYLDPDWIRIRWGPWIRIRIRNLDSDPRGQK